MKERWQGRLQAEIKGAGKLVIIGTGNALKGDDAIGLLVAGLLDSNLNRYQKKKVKVLRAHETIELYLKTIKRIKPSHLIIVEAMNTGKPPGTIRVDKINVSHKPGSQMVEEVNDFLEKLATVSSAKVYLVSIQPENLEFGHPITQSNRLSAKKLVESISEIFPRKPQLI